MNSMMKLWMKVLDKYRRNLARESMAMANKQNMSFCRDFRDVTGLWSGSTVCVGAEPSSCDGS